MRMQAFAAVCLVILAGCAQTPAITTSYYPAATSMRVQLVRTLACDKNDMPIVATTPTITMSQRADTASPQTLSFADLDGALANTDIKMEFYPDRRLKTINATFTGQGQEILKSAISLATAVVGGRLRNPYAEECKVFKAHFGDEPLTLIFSADDDFGHLGSEVPIMADAQSDHYAKMFPTLLGTACFKTGAAQGLHPPVTMPPGGGYYTVLHLRQPGQVPVTVYVGTAASCAQTAIWAAVVPVGQAGVNYEIPIPKGAAFGKQTFAISLDEAGGLGSLQYATEDGKSAALDTFKAGYDALHKTDAEKTADATGAADLIAAQQRLVKCRATPEDC